MAALSLSRHGSTQTSGKTAPCPPSISGRVSTSPYRKESPQNRHVGRRHRPLQMGRLLLLCVCAKWICPGRFIPVAGKQIWISSQFDNLPFLCCGCGFLGHDVSMCTAPAIYLNDRRGRRDLALRQRLLLLRDSRGQRSSPIWDRAPPIHRNGPAPKPPISRRTTTIAPILKTSHEIPMIARLSFSLQRVTRRNSLTYSALNCLLNLN